MSQAHVAVLKHSASYLSMSFGGEPKILDLHVTARHSFSLAAKQLVTPCWPEQAFCSC